MKSSLNAQHHQCSDWLKELAFYKEEMALLNKRLEEVVSKNNSKEALAQVEHHQNKLIMLNEQCDILKHDVSQRDQQLLAQAAQSPTHISEKAHPVDEQLQESVKDFTKSFADSRYELNVFVGQMI